MYGCQLSSSVSAPLTRRSPSPPTVRRGLPPCHDGKPPSTQSRRVFLLKEKVLRAPRSPRFHWLRARAASLRTSAGGRRHEPTESRDRRRESEHPRLWNRRSVHAAARIGAGTRLAPPWVCPASTGGPPLSSRRP